MFEYWVPIVVTFYQHTLEMFPMNSGGELLTLVALGTLLWKWGEIDRERQPFNPQHILKIRWKICHEWTRFTPLHCLCFLQVKFPPKSPIMHASPMETTLKQDWQTGTNRTHPYKWLFIQKNLQSPGNRVWQTGSIPVYTCHISWLLRLLPPKSVGLHPISTNIYIYYYRERERDR